MGTSYTFDGSIHINPPLNFVQIQQAKKIAMESLRAGFDRKHANEDNVFEGYMPLKPHLVKTEKTTDEGVLTVIQATDLVPSHPDQGSLSYDMGDLLYRLTQAFPENQFHGTVIALREDGVNAVKLVVKAAKKGQPSAVQQTDGWTHIHWDDQSEPTKIYDLTF